MPCVPTKWLRERVDVPIDLSTGWLAVGLVCMGLEKERTVPPAVTGPLIVGKVLIYKTKKQSNGRVIDHCRADVGPKHNDAPGTGKEPSDPPSYGIACGIHNFDAGDYVIVYLPGAVLPGDFRIAAYETYGHVSGGMIRSARELGIGEGHSGVITLQQWLVEYGHGGEEPPTPGTDVISIFGLGEEIPEINVTPDRGYCFTMCGVARKYSHSTDARFTNPADVTNTGLYSSGVAGAGQGGYDVVVPGDPRPIYGRPGCDRYVARPVRGIDPSASSPTWIQDRLTVTGMRPVSLAMDVANYVILDPGQPLYVSDTGKLTIPIVVRRAKDGERLTFLDEITHSLDPEGLVIAGSPDGEGSWALILASVFDGVFSEVDADACDVLIEAAHFDPVSVARSSRHRKLFVESSKHNECGVGTELAPIVAQRAVSLLAEYGDGTAEPVAVDINHTRVPEPITMHASTAERFIGVVYGTEHVIELLITIGRTVERGGSADDGTALLTVTPPTWRPGLVGPAHLIKEIACLGGYNVTPVIMPTASAGTGLSADQRARHDIVRALTDAGLTQVLSYPFIGDVHDLPEIPANDAR